MVNFDLKLAIFRGATVFKLDTAIVSLISLIFKTAIML